MDPAETVAFAFSDKSFAAFIAKLRNHRAPEGWVGRIEEAAKHGALRSRGEVFDFIAAQNELNLALVEMLFGRRIKEGPDDPDALVAALRDAVSAGTRASQALLTEIIADAGPEDEHHA